MPKGPRREPAAPKRSRRTESGAGAGVLMNAPGTGRMGVVAAILCKGRWSGPKTGGLLAVSRMSLMVSCSARKGSREGMSARVEAEAKKCCKCSVPPYWRKGIWKCAESKIAYDRIVKIKDAEKSRNRKQKDDLGWKIRLSAGSFQKLLPT